MVSRIVAQPFTTGSDGYAVSSVTLPRTTSAASELPSLELFSGSADGTRVATFTGTFGDPHMRYVPSSPLTLEPSTTYWLVAEAPRGRWDRTDSTNVDSGGAEGWSIGAGESRRKSDTGSFTSFASDVFLFQVDGYEVCWFPDAGLRAGIEAELGVSAGAQVTPQGISGLVSLDLSGASVADVRGLECAPSLKYVTLDNNHITDLSPLAGIERLYTLSLRHNRLSGAVDLAGFHGDDTDHHTINPDSGDRQPAVVDGRLVLGRSSFGALTVLDLDYNDISSVDVTSLGTNLRSLYASGNRLSSIDVSANTDLRRLQLSSNNLTSIDLSDLTDLESLYIAKNSLTSLNVSANTKLRWLYIEGNPDLTALDVTGLNMLQTLRTSLAESAITGLTKRNTTTHPQPRTITGTVTHVGTYYHYIDPDLIGGI